MEKKNTKKILIGAVILVVLIAVFAGFYFKFSAKPVAGGKTVTIQVNDSNGKSLSYEVSTDAEYLKGAMDDLAASDDSFSYSGTEGDYGIMVEVINDEQAVYDEDGAYWALYVNGDYGQYSADQQPLTDGDTYTWTYEKAY
ncbi:MAG: DUF4430 domain-containing protein [Pseudobutyrivibrio sp.]|nr:DUF4430 domain-containing protein [Pseudobutyrivibrio sp.]